MNDGPVMALEEAIDITEDVPLPGAASLTRDIANDDLAADQDDPTARAPTSDPTPGDLDAAFAGTPLTDAEVAALPVEEVDDP